MVSWKSAAIPFLDVIKYRAGLLSTFVLGRPYQFIDHNAFPVMSYWIQTNLNDQTQILLDGYGRGYRAVTHHNKSGRLKFFLPIKIVTCHFQREGLNDLFWNRHRGAIRMNDRIGTTCNVLTNAFDFHTFGWIVVLFGKYKLMSPVPWRVRVKFRIR